MDDHPAAADGSRDSGLLIQRVVASLLAFAAFDAVVAATGFALFFLLPWGPSYLLGDVTGRLDVVGDSLLAQLGPRWVLIAPALAASLLAALFSPGGRGPFVRILRLTVTDEAGEPPSVTRRFVRWVGLCLKALTWGIPALWALVDAHGRAPHDLLSGTRVRRSPSRVRHRVR